MAKEKMTISVRVRMDAETKEQFEQIVTEMRTTYSAQVRRWIWAEARKSEKQKWRDAK